MFLNRVLTMGFIICLMALRHLGIRLCKYQSRVHTVAPTVIERLYALAQLPDAPLQLSPLFCLRRDVDVVAFVCFARAPAGPTYGAFTVAALSERAKTSAEATR